MAWANGYDDFLAHIHAPVYASLAIYKDNRNHLLTGDTAMQIQHIFNDWRILAAMVYVSVWVLLFLLGVFFGLGLKKDLLGNGVKCGIVNSFLLSAVWPITILCGCIGWCYEVWQGWKRL